MAILDRVASNGIAAWRVHPRGRVNLARMSLLRGAWTYTLESFLVSTFIVHTAAGRPHVWVW